MLTMDAFQYQRGIYYCFHKINSPRIQPDNALLRHFYELADLQDR